MSSATSPPPAPSRNSSDYFSSSRPAPRIRQTSSGGGDLHVRKSGTPGSPRTPLLGRSISSQFGSPGTFRTEAEEQVVYELGARHLSVGFAGEARPRCIYPFTPEKGRRVGDYRLYNTNHARRRRIAPAVKEEAWGREYELYRTDLRQLDLELYEDKLERAVRSIHSEYLQLDPKPRKAALAVESLLPTPLLEIVLKVLFNHHNQPPSVMILTTPILAAVSAGLRHALVIDIGWEESVVTAVGEYKEVSQQRSVRAGRMLTWEMKALLEAEGKKAVGEQVDAMATFKDVEEAVERMAWCRSRSTVTGEASSEQPTKRIPLPGHTHGAVDVPFDRLANPADTVLFATDTAEKGLDDHELPLHELAFRILVSLPVDLRSLCVSRIIITGGAGRLPGLKPRLLSELQNLLSKRGGWDPVHSYGSATDHHTRILRERSANAPTPSNRPSTEESAPSLSPTKKPLQDSLPHHQRVHDDVKDPITLKAERHAFANKDKGVVRTLVRGVETLGAWAGASMIAGLRVKGVHEVEREEFLKHGFRDGVGGAVI